MRDERAAPGAQARSDAQRFTEDIPAWISGGLPPEAKQWMAEKATQHPDWAQEADWMREFRAQVQQCAQQESTSASWAMLQGRLQAAPTADSERALWQRRRQAASGEQQSTPFANHRARLQRWWRSPMWSNALASVALAAVLGHAGWQLWGWESSAQGTGQGVAWRSGGLEDLAVPAPVQPMWQAAVQLPAGLSASQWHTAVAALGAGVQVQPLHDGRWLLALPDTQSLAQWRTQLLAQPGLSDAQWQDLPLASTALPAAAQQP